jgi:hypothetical protein
MQTLFAQRWPVGQSSGVEQQDALAMQTTPHCLDPLPQMHWAEVHVPPAPQSESTQQSPAALEHEPLHRCCPAGQAHEPVWQVFPP